MTGLARKIDPATSHDAANSLTDDQLNRSEYMVLLAIRWADEPVADHELCDYNMLTDHLSPSRIRTARSVLARRGLIVQGPDTTSPSGRRCRTWQEA